MTEPIDDPFAVLGLDRDATPEQVRRRYKDLAVQHHPDRNPDLHSSEEFKRIAAAYAILNDDQARRRWQQQRAEAAFNDADLTGDELSEHRVQSATRRTPDPAERLRREKFARQFAEALAQGPESFAGKDPTLEHLRIRMWIAAALLVGALIGFAVAIWLQI